MDKEKLQRSGYVQSDCCYTLRELASILGISKESTLREHLRRIGCPIVSVARKPIVSGRRFVNAIETYEEPTEFERP